MRPVEPWVATPQQAFRSTPPSAAPSYPPLRFAPSLQHSRLEPGIDLFTLDPPTPEVAVACLVSRRAGSSNDALADEVAEIALELMVATQGLRDATASSRLSHGRICQLSLPAQMPEVARALVRMVAKPNLEADVKRRYALTREGVLSARRGRGGFIRDVAHHLAFAAPLAADRLGLLDTLTPEAIHRHTFQPDDVALFVASSTPHEELRRTVTPIAQAWRPAPGEPLPAVAKEAELGLPDGAAEADALVFRAGAVVLAVTTKAPALGSPDEHSFAVLAHVLGEGLSSRLNRRLREEMGVTYGVDAAFVPKLDGGYLDVVARADAEGAENAVIALHEELEKLVATPIAMSELKAAKRGVRASLHHAASGPLGSVAVLARYYGLRRSPEAIEDEDAAVARLTREDIQRVARVYLTQRSLSSSPLPARFARSFCAHDACPSSKPRSRTSRRRCGAER
ncbi:MAG: insulinase family protein [Myxococcota bacterium]